MSHHASSWAIEAAPQYVEYTEQDGQRVPVVLDKPDPYGKLVLLVVADFASPEGVTWRGSREIGQKAGIPAATARKVLGRLEDQGLLCRVPRTRDDGSQTSSIIVLAPRGNRGSMTDPRGHEQWGREVAEYLDTPRAPEAPPCALKAPPRVLKAQGRASGARRTEPVSEPTAAAGTRDARGDLDAVLERLAPLVADGRLVEPGMDGGDLVLHDALLANDTATVNAALDHVVAWLSDKASPIRTRHLSRLLPSALEKARGSSSADSGSDGPSWEDALAKVAEVAPRCCQPLEPVQDLTALRLLGDAPEVAALVAAEGWGRVVLATVDSWDGRQAATELRKGWRQVRPDRQRVADRIARLEAWVADHCERVGVTPDMIGATL